MRCPGAAPAAPVPHQAPASAVPRGAYMMREMPQNLVPGRWSVPGCLACCRRSGMLVGKAYGRVMF